MLWLLVLIFVTAFISMVFNVAYILHELGWFPHGKYRGPVSFLVETRHGGYRPSNEEWRRNDMRYAFQSPYVETLRRHVYPDLYAADDKTARISRLLQRWIEQPSVGRMEDLINVMNSITITEEPTAEVHGLIEKGTQEILNYDVSMLLERETSRV